MAIQLKNLLASSIQDAGIDRQVSAAVICSEFDRLLIEIIGEKVKNMAQAKYVKNETLTVAVTSSSLGQEIKLNEMKILKKLGEKVGENKVNNIRFLV